MSIDSEAKRKAAQGLPFAPTPPVADGEIDAADRAALTGVYLPSEDEAPEGWLVGWWPWGNFS